MAAYAPVFRSAGVGGFLVKALDDEALERRLGVTTAAHRARVLSSLASLFPGADAPPESVAARMLRMSDVELNDFIADLFVSADKDRSGSLDRKEFKDLLKTADLGFSAKDIRAVMEECDEDGDGLIDYGEFIPIMTGLVRNFAAKKRAQEKRERAGLPRGWTQKGKGPSAEALLHGMDRAALEHILARVFNGGDADGSGVLDRREFTACLRSADLGLTRKEINALLSKVDGDGDGCVSYAEFVPIAFAVLVERLADDVATSSALSSPAALQRLVHKTLEAATSSPRDLGELVPAAVVRDALVSLRDHGVGLTRMQIATVMSEVEMDAQRRVAWRDFAPNAAEMLWCGPCASC